MMSTSLCAVQHSVQQAWQYLCQKVTKQPHRDSKRSQAHGLLAKCNWQAWCMMLTTDIKHPCYYIQGEQTQAVSSKSKEADGITAVPDPPAPEEEEEPAPPEADPEAEEGDEPKPEAAAEEKLPAAAKNPDEFPQKDGIIIELSALPSVSSQHNCGQALCRVCCRTGRRQSNVMCLWEAASQSGVTKAICVVKVVNMLQSNSCNCMCIPVRQENDLPACQPADIKPILQPFPRSFLPIITKLQHARDRSPQVAKLLGSQAAPLSHSQSNCKQDWVDSACKAPSCCLTLLGCRQQGAL